MVSYIKDSGNTLITPACYQKIYITKTGYYVTPHYIFNSDNTILKPGCIVEPAPSRIEGLVNNVRVSDFDVVLRRAISQERQGNAMLVHVTNPVNYCFVPAVLLDPFVNKGVALKTGVFATSYIKIENKHTKAVIAFLPRIHLQKESRA